MAYESPLEGQLIAASLLTYAYPVGTIYMTWGTTSPATFLGGTWTQIQDTFLMAAGSTYTAASTGGSATRTLSSSNLPSHSHTASGSTGNSSATHTHSWSGTTNTTGAHTDYIGRDTLLAASGVNRLSVHSTGLTSVNPPTSSNGAHTHSISGTTGNVSANHTHTWSGFTSGSAGQASPTAIDTLPPYRAVTVWKRTA